MYILHKSLSLNNITIEFRTNNAIENYNGRFKEMNGMETDMPAFIFINNIVEDIQEHITIIRDIENKDNFKNISKIQLYKKLNKVDKKTEAFGDVSNDILKYLETTEIDLNINNSFNIVKLDINNSIDNEIKKKNKLNIKHVNNIFWFKNQDNSCAFNNFT